MAERGLCLALELRDNALRQHLAQFHAPLIERIDVPDDALGEHVVFLILSLAGLLQGVTLGVNDCHQFVP